MNTFIQQAYIKVIKSYSKGIIMLQKICIIIQTGLSVQQIILNKCSNIKQILIINKNNYLKNIKRQEAVFNHL